MASGLYIHVPFCRQKCAYCDFYSVAATPEAIERYLQLVVAEAELRGQGQTINTVFWGGGTPSLLTPRQISTVLDRVSRYFCVAQDAEITMEANPETLEPQGLLAYRQAGINRLSLGVQSLEPGLLPLLGRRHTAEQALAAVTWAQAAGFSSLSCDLIYGIPGQTLASWQHDVQTLAACGVPHLSLYCLEVYEATPLGRAVAGGRVPRPDDDLAADMYDWARAYLPGQGLPQYEISNFARPGWECKHNINYWQNGEYFGLGPAACSYWQGVRDCNVRDLAAYEQQISCGRRPIGSSECLDEQGAAAETVILGLRLNAGVDGIAFAQRFGYTLETAFGDVIEELLHKGWLVRTSRGYALAKKMQPIANSVFCSFLSDSNT